MSASSGTSCPSRSPLRTQPYAMRPWAIPCDEVFEVPGLADEPVEVVEDHTVDDTVGGVGQELAEFGAQDHPVDGAVGLDDLALLESGGVVLAVNLGERAPAQACTGVFGALKLALDAGLQAEAVRGDPQVRARAPRYAPGRLGAYAARWSWRLRVTCPPRACAGTSKSSQTVGAAVGTVSAPGARWVRYRALSVELRGLVVPWIRCRIRGRLYGY